MPIKIEGDGLKKLNSLQRAPFLRKMVKEAGVIAIRFSKDRFVHKNWLDKTRKPWQKRERHDRGSLMIRTGRLKRSIRKVREGAFYVVIGTDVPYAQIHNEGGQIKKNVRVRAHRRRTKRGMVPVEAHQRKMNLKMPKRQFLGDSAFLSKYISRHMMQEVEKRLK